MILQSTDELEKYIGNKYSLVIVSAKRARQLREGHSPLARDNSPNFLSQALREIEEEQLQATAPVEEEIAPAPRDMIASLVAGADFDLDEDMDLDEGDAVDDLAALLVGADDEEEEEEGTRTPTDDVLAPVIGAAATDEEESEEETADDEEEEEDLTAADDGDEEEEE